MKTKRKTEVKEGVSDHVLNAIGRIIPGFHGFFQKMEKSKTFGLRMSEIRKEMNRRFGHLKK